jgi:hypothetical protein
LLTEYNHQCAICGAARPQIHHIDENPSNNKLENLVPLCPNHHLSDQHNPTTKIPEQRLALFRKYKDPQILCPEFSPLYQRFSFLLNRPIASNYTDLANHSHDLIRFVEHLQMGGYYAGALRPLLDWNWQRPYAEGEREAFQAEQEQRYQAQLSQHADRVVELLVEQLRYQLWPMYEANGPSRTYSG